MARNVDLARIVLGCQQGDEQCFEHLVDMYSGRLYGYFYRLSGDRDASDELLSEFYVKLVEKIGQYHGGVFEGWLFAIAANLFHDYLRRKQRRQKLLEMQKTQVRVNVQTASSTADEGIDALQKQLEKLDADTRELIVLRFYSQLSFKEMAQLRSEPIGTTLAKTHRGLKRLRETMEGL